MTWKPKPAAQCERHNCLVVYTRRWRDWFARRYWLVCCHCDLMHGQYTNRFTAQLEADEWNNRQ